MSPKAQERYKEIIAKPGEVAQTLNKFKSENADYELMDMTFMETGVLAGHFSLLFEVDGPEI